MDRGLTRGDVFTVATGANFGGKPRPAIIIQGNPFLSMPTILIAPLTTDLERAIELRPIIYPDQANGLREPSAVMLNVLLAVPSRHVGRFVGTLSSSDLEQVDLALLLLLGLA